MILNNNETNLNTYQKENNLAYNQSIQKIEKMKITNRQRIQSIADYPNIPPLHMRQSWNQEYFPPSNDARMWEQLGMKNSIIQNSDECVPEEYQKLVYYYQQQNEQIQARNGELVQMARLLKEKQSFLLEEISVLQMHYRKLQKTVKRQPAKQPFKEIQRQNMSNSIIRKQPSTKDSQQLNLNSFIIQKSSSKVQLPMRKQKQVLMQSLNSEFCQIIEQSIQQKDAVKRKALRKQLAELATQIKKLRINEEKEEKTVVQKAMERQSSSNKTVTSQSKGCSLKVIDRPLLKQSSSMANIAQSSMANVRKN